MAAQALDLRNAYRLMVLTRRYDEAAINLQRQGEITAFPPMSGQEASQVASVLALRETDMIFPSYRELGAAVARGVDMVGYFLAYRGAWNGGLYDPRRHSFAPIASSVGSHLLHATGFAMGAAKKGLDQVAIVYFGDGATSEGDASEAFNFAGVFRAPVIFFCQNNGWAISVPLERQTAGEIWKRAEGFGFAGVRIDGNDAQAVFAATSDAAGRARSGGGPTLIEAMTERHHSHSTADDQSRYRPPAELERARLDDPIRRLRQQLEEEGATGAFFDEVEKEAREAVAALREDLRQSPDPPALEMFDYVYSSPPGHLRRQRDRLADLPRADV